MPSKTWIRRLTLLLSLITLGAVTALWTLPQLRTGPILEGPPTPGIHSGPLNPTHIVFLGDSITRGGPWAQMFPDLPVRNFGVNGDTTTDVLARLGIVVAAKPKAVFLKIGTNDLVRGPSDRQQSYRQYREILQRIQSGSPGTQLYAQSILPRRSYFRDEVEAFNREIRGIAVQLGIPYIDLYPHFLAKDGSIADEFSYDELHLSREGYQLWQTLLEPIMERLEN